MLRNRSLNPSAVYLATLKVYISTRVWRETTVLLTWKLECQVFSPPSELPLQAGRVPQAESKWVRLFSVVPSNRTRDNGHKLKHRKFQLNMRKNFFTLRVTEPWHRLPREAVDSPSLEIFKTRLDKVLCTLL